jgi:hypothetical protein
LAGSARNGRKSIRIVDIKRESDNDHTFETWNQISQLNPNLWNSRYHNFNLLKYLTSGRIKLSKMRLELGSYTNEYLTLVKFKINARNLAFQGHLT